MNSITMHLPRRVCLSISMLACLAGLLTLLPPALVHAQSSPAEAAKAHYQRGQELYSQEEYAEAADELRRAYALAPFPLFLYNISLAEWRDGRWEAALQTALRAREEGVPAEIEPKLEARIAALGQLIGARQMAKDVSAAASSPVAEVTEDAEIDEMSVADPGFGTRGWVGTGLAAVGVGLLSGALYVDYQLGQDDDAFEDAAKQGSEAEYTRRLADLEERQMVGRVLAVSGAVLAVTGTTLIIIELSDAPAHEQPSTARLQATPRLDGAELRLSLTF